jgi:hypothetical protein
MLALLVLFSNVGVAEGNSISGAIWTHTFPEPCDDYCQWKLPGIGKCSTETWPCNSATK